MNIIITSEHRVGSRWLHYLLADILEMSVSPEMDGAVENVKERKQDALHRFANNKIVKYHHGTPATIMKGLGKGDYKIIGVVRNPRDRAVSRAFHDFYHPKHSYQVKKYASSDFEAVKWVVEESPPFEQDSWRQIQHLMLDGYSTRCHLFDSLPYIWTSYEWMTDDIHLEVSKILDFLGARVKPFVLKTAIQKNAFESKAKRPKGTEDRQDTWRRKGMMLDWINWFDEEMLNTTIGMQGAYWRKLVTNGGNDEWQN